jgi:ClpP class serine protease
MGMGEIFWVIIGVVFLLASVLPAIARSARNQARIAKLRSLEQKRKSRVITLIHRQETLAFLGLPFARYMDIEDSERVLRAIRLTEPQVPIDLVLHTPGGLVLAAEQIAYALCAREAPVTVFVPHYAMSGGTLIALAADAIVMDPNAVLGPIDPQIRNIPAASVLAAVARKSIDEVDDETLILADVGEKAIRQVKRTIARVLQKRMNLDRAGKLAELLASGTWTHDYPITVSEAQGLGLDIATDVPQEVYDLMDLYPQTSARRPSVQYIAAPRREPKDDETQSRLHW